MPLLSTYSDWTAALERFSKGDDTVLADMDKGKFVLDAGTAQRFYSRVEEVYKARKKSWLDKFNNSFQVQNIKSDDDFGIIIRNAKVNLVPLSRFVLAKGLPEDLRSTLLKDLEDFVSEMKKSLKDNVSKTSNGREKMLMHLSNFGIYQPQQETPTQTITKSTTTTLPPTGRKIIF